MDKHPPPALAPLGYLLHLADNALTLGQRNAEWCGHGPALEEDIALANMSLDLIGQARMLYQYAAERINADSTLAAQHAHLSGARVDGQATEDTLAYFRDTHEFCNYTLTELPHHGPLASTAASARDYATTIVRNFLYSALMVLLWERLSQCADQRLAAIAGKSLKEVRYHLRHSTDWLERLGDGTDESHLRAQAALDHLLPFTQEFWLTTPDEAAASASATGVEASTLRADWEAMLQSAVAAATLKLPKASGYVTQGKRRLHSEHLGFLLAEMQSLARVHPQARW